MKYKLLEIQEGLCSADPSYSFGQCEEASQSEKDFSVLSVNVSSLINAGKADCE